MPQLTFLKWPWCFLLCAFLLAGCVDTVELKMPANEKLMTINGLITTDPGPYYVRINKSVPYGGPLAEIDPAVKDAEVTIEDDLGNREVLAQYQYGTYRTGSSGLGAIQGRVGGTYILTVKLVNGQVYKSKAELLPPVPPIENIKADYQAGTKLDKDNLEQPDNRFRVSLEIKDPAGQRNFYRWDWTGVYEVATQPWDYKERIPSGAVVSRPKACCATCWVKDSLNPVQVIDDRLFDGNTVREQPVALVPINPQTMNLRYRVEVRQYSLTEAAFDYWRVLALQTTKTGSVLDPPPANAKGNLYNVNDPEEQVIGYFGASAIVRKVINLKREDVPTPLVTFDYDDDCRVIQNSTSLKPSFW